MTRELDDYLAQQNEGGFSTPPPTRRLTIPQGAGPGTPRIVINGTGTDEPGNIVIYGANDNDKIVISADGPDNIPIINFQNSDSPGDTITGIRYIPFDSFWISSDSGVETVDQRGVLSLAPGNINLAFYEEGTGDFHGGHVGLNDILGQLAYSVGNVVKTRVFASENALVLNANSTTDGSDLVEIYGNLTIGETGNNPAMQEQYAEQLGAVAVAVGTAFSNGGSNNGFVFTAPPSGSVDVTLGGGIGSNAATVGRISYHSFEIREGGTLGAGVVHTAASDDRAKMFWCATATAGNKYVFGTEKFTVPGLTPGDVYNVRCMGRANNAADTWLRFNWSIRLAPVLLTGS